MADGLLVLSCYERLKAVGEACQTLHFPNVRAVSVSIANKDETKNFGLLERKAEKYVLLAEFNVELYHTVSAFKAARIICPVFVQWLSPSDGTVKALKISPFLIIMTQTLTPCLKSYGSRSRPLKTWSFHRKRRWWNGGSITQNNFLIGLLLLRKYCSFNHHPLQQTETVFSILPSMRVAKSIFVSRNWLIFVRVKYEMLVFGAVKCDLFYARERA